MNLLRSFPFGKCWDHEWNIPLSPPTNQFQVPGGDQMFPVFCFSPGKSDWAIRLYLPSLGTRDVLQYIKFNFLGRLYQPGTLDMMTSCRTTEHNPTNTRKSGTVRERHWTLNGLFFWENIISDSVFLPLIGLLLSSYSSRGVPTPVGSPLLRSGYFSDRAELAPLSLYPSTAGSSTWNWWAVLRLLRTGERESHPGTGGRGSIRWEGREASRVSHHTALNKKNFQQSTDAS